MTAKRLKPNLSETIAANIERWDKEQTVADFVREELMQIEPRTNKPLRSSVVKRLAYLTENALEHKDQIKAAEVLLNFAAAGDSKPLQQPQGNTQINFFQMASDKINQSVASLIDVTPKGKKKQGIEAII